jgi:biotin carboxyl carrier protein
MKMENEINAYGDGVVENILVSLNDQVEKGKTLLHLKKFISANESTN